MSQLGYPERELEAFGITSWPAFKTAVASECMQLPWIMMGGTFTITFAYNNMAQVLMILVVLICLLSYDGLFQRAYGILFNRSPQVMLQICEPHGDRLRLLLLLV